MAKRKKGEQEAIIILEILGIEIDEDYYDDNSSNSMPDIRCKDGRYIEVTHTLHNNAIPTKIRDFDKLRPGEDGDSYTQRRLNAEIECNQALDRVRNQDYEKDDMRKLTSAGRYQYKKDAKFIKDHLGYDVTEKDFNKQQSEFKCDHPTIIFSPDNILREITKDKGKKYPAGDVDLFVYAAEEEIQLMKELIQQVEWNLASTGFLKTIEASPFRKIYVCEWDFERQMYNLDNPHMVIFCNDDNGMKWEWK